MTTIRRWRSVRVLSMLAILAMLASSWAGLTSCSKSYDEELQPSDGSVSDGQNTTTDASALDVESGASTDGGDGEAIAIVDGGPDARLSKCGAQGTLCPTKLCNDNTGVCEFAVFITSEVFDGNLASLSVSGLQAADTKCMAAGKSAGLVRPSRAWLSDSTTDAITRLSMTAGPYRMLDGTLIASNIAELVVAGPKAPIVIQETGLKLAFGGQLVWTGTNKDGKKTPFHCTSWTTNVAGEQATQGDPTETIGNWTDQRTATCAGFQRLYCFEQPF